MSASPANGADRLPRLLDRLGYTPQAGWIAATDFGALTTHRFAMQQAEREMSVIGAFCLKRRTGPSETIATPLVYVAQVADVDAAQEAHRKVWSQGLAPFLLVATPDRVALCPGFSYAGQDWHHFVQWFSWTDVESSPRTQTDTVALIDPVAELWDLCAIRLRTSLFWR